MPELPEVQKIAKDTIEYIKKETALPAERRCRNDKAYHLISGCGCTLYACEVLFVVCSRRRLDGSGAPEGLAALAQLQQLRRP